MRVPRVLVRVVSELRNERAARAVSIHHDLERIVVKAGIGKVPEVVIGLIQKVQAVQALHPTHFHVDVKILRVWLVVLVLIVVHLIEADRVTLRHHRPITVVAIDAGNLVCGKLEDLEDLIRSRSRPGALCSQYRLGVCLLSRLRL